MFNGFVPGSRAEAAPPLSYCLRRFEKIDPDTNTKKFWEVVASKGVVTRHYGRIGTTGQTTVNNFTMECDQSKFVNDLVTEKLREGYKELHKDSTGNFVRLTHTYPARPSMSPLEQGYRPSTKVEKVPVPIVTPYYNPFTHTTPVAYKSTELDKMPPVVLQDLALKVQAELDRRSTQHKVTKAQLDASKNADIDALQNFLRGVAHACACRSALRFAAGHNPHGTNPEDGTCWNPLDGQRVIQQVIQERGPDKIDTNRDLRWQGVRLRSNPMSWTTTGDQDHWLRLPRWIGAGGFSKDKAEYLH